MMIAVGSDGDSSSEEEKPKKKASPTVTAKKAPAKKKKNACKAATGKHTRHFSPCELNFVVNVVNR